MTLLLSERCKSRSPTGEVFKVSKNAKWENGRIESVDDVINTLLIIVQYVMYVCIDTNLAVPDSSYLIVPDST